MILLIVILVVVGVVLYMLRGKIDPTIYNIIIVLIVLAVAVYNSGRLPTDFAAGPVSH